MYPSIASRSLPFKTLTAATLIVFSTLCAGAQNERAAAAQTIRGTVEKVSPGTLAIKTASGSAEISLIQPLSVYGRQHSDLKHVKPSSFVGITSVKQPDGTERATEVHIFPEALRGTGEGSYMMSDASGHSTSNRMTNGSIAGPRMTNGTVSSGAHGRTVTVDYGAGKQVIDIPRDTPVTVIAPLKKELTVGDNVVVLAHKTSSGALATDSVLLILPPK